MRGKCLCGAIRFELNGVIPNLYQCHCSLCGSPLPNLTANDSAWWVPVGLLEDDAELELGAHLFIGSRASWDVIADVGEHFDEMPDAETLGCLLQPSKSPL